MDAPDQPSRARSKDDARRLRLASRAVRDDAARRAAGDAIAAHLRAWTPLTRARSVAAYLSFGDEPPTDVLVDALRTDGVRVLVPRIRADRGLDWVAHTGPTSIRPGRLGIPEPLGEPDPEGLDAVDVVLVPALAADRSGTRLGRGAGYYDRALATSRGPRVVVLFDDDLLPAGTLPAEPHDVPVTHAVTPAGVHRLG